MAIKAMQSCSSYRKLSLMACSALAALPVHFLCRFHFQQCSCKPQNLQQAVIMLAKANGVRLVPNMLPLLPSAHHALYLHDTVFMSLSLFYAPSGTPL